MIGEPEGADERPLQRAKPWAHAVFGVALFAAWISVLALWAGNEGMALSAGPTIVLIGGIWTVFRLSDPASRGAPDHIVAVGFFLSILAVMMAAAFGLSAAALLLGAVAPLGLVLSFIRFRKEGPGRPRPRPRGHVVTVGELLGIPNSAIAAQGANGMMGLDGDRLRILHRGMRAGIGMGFGSGVKEIAVASITATQWKDAGDLWLGFFGVSYIGGTDPSGGLLTDVSNENTVTFTKAQQPVFEAFRRAVEAQRGAKQVGPTSPWVGGAGAPVTLRDVDPQRGQGTSPNRWPGGSFATRPHPLHDTTRSAT